LIAGVVLFQESTFKPRHRMAITLEANYSKKLGLPGYSSHQYSITIRTELTYAKQVESESTRLCSLLQGCVDKDIQQCQRALKTSQQRALQNQPGI